MADNDSNGEKTEQATAKKKRDARREGQVARSKDLSQTATLAVWAMILAGFAGVYADRLSYLVTLSWTQVANSDMAGLAALGRAAFEVFLLLSILPLAIVGVCGCLIELMQVGPLFAAKRIVPQAKRIDPAAGFKRMWSSQNLIEVIKALGKTAALVVLTALMVRAYLPDILDLPRVSAEVTGALQKHLLLMLMAWIILLFAFLSVADWLLRWPRICGSP